MLSDTQRNVDRVGVFWRTKCFLQLICAEMEGVCIFRLGVFSWHYDTSMQIQYLCISTMVVLTNQIAQNEAYKSFMNLWLGL